MTQGLSFFRIDHYFLGGGFLFKFVKRRFFEIFICEIPIRTLIYLVDFGLWLDGIELFLSIGLRTKGGGV
jgi:hypothetical protein